MLALVCAETTGSGEKTAVIILTFNLETPNIASKDSFEASNFLGWDYSSYSREKKTFNQTIK